MSERGAVRFGESTIEFEVQRSQRRRKTVQITVDGGGVQVTAPVSTPADELRGIVRKRAAWIMRRSTAETLAAAPKRFVSGETLPYLGRNVRLLVEHADVRSVSVRFDHWRFRVTVPTGASDSERTRSAQRALVAWYRRRAADRLPTSVERWWPRLGHGDWPRVLIRDQRRRWGSCAPDGTLRFNWRAMMLEPALVEYIVVHELAHLSIKNHGPDFWGLVARAMPDAQQRRRRLREAGHLLPL